MPFLIKKVLAPVVQKVDNAIHRINHYQLDSAIGFPKGRTIRRSQKSDGGRGVGRKPKKFIQGKMPRKKIYAKKKVKKKNSCRRKVQL